MDSNTVSDDYLYPYIVDYVGIQIQVKVKLGYVYTNKCIINSLVVSKTENRKYRISLGCGLCIGHEKVVLSHH